MRRCVGHETLSAASKEDVALLIVRFSEGIVANLLHLLIFKTLANVHVAKELLLRIFGVAREFFEIAVRGNLFCAKIGAEQGVIGSGTATARFDLITSFFASFVADETTHKSFRLGDALRV